MESVVQTPTKRLYLQLWYMPSIIYSTSVESIYIVGVGACLMLDSCIDMRTIHAIDHLSLKVIRGASFSNRGYKLLYHVFAAATLP